VALGEHHAYRRRRAEAQLHLLQQERLATRAAARLEQLPQRDGRADERADQRGEDVVEHDERSLAQGSGLLELAGEQPMALVGAQVAVSSTCGTGRIRLIASASV